MVERKDDALDVMQEVWLRVFRNLGSLQSAEAMPVWLYRIAHNSAMTHLRKVCRWKEIHEDIGDYAIAELPADESFSRISTSEVHNALGQLPIPERKVILGNKIIKPERTLRPDADCRYRSLLRE